jgi:hypothetical protein
VLFGGSTPLSRARAELFTNLANAWWCDVPSDRLDKQSPNICLVEARVQGLLDRRLPDLQRSFPGGRPVLDVIEGLPCFSFQRGGRSGSSEGTELLLSLSDVQDMLRDRWSEPSGNNQKDQKRVKREAGDVGAAGVDVRGGGQPQAPPPPSPPLPPPPPTLPPPPPLNTGPGAVGQEPATVLSHELFVRMADSSGQDTRLAGRLRHGIINYMVKTTQPVTLKERVWCASEAHIAARLQQWQARDWDVMCQQFSRPVPALLQGVPCFEVTVVDPGASLEDAPPEKVQVRFLHAELIKLNSSGWKQPAVAVNQVVVAAPRSGTLAPASAAGDTDAHESAPDFIPL